MMGDSMGGVGAGSTPLHFRPFWSTRRGGAFPPGCRHALDRAIYDHAIYDHAIDDQHRLPCLRVGRVKRICDQLSHRGLQGLPAANPTA